MLNAKGGSVPSLQPAHWFDLLVTYPRWLELGVFAALLAGRGHCAGRPLGVGADGFFGKRADDGSKIEVVRRRVANPASTLGFL